MKDLLRTDALVDELNEHLTAEEEAAMLDALAMGAELSPPIPPPLGLKARILRSFERPRYAFLDRVARLLDLSLEAARAALDSLDRPYEWEPGGDGCVIRHVQGGPRLANAVVGLVRVEGGTPFPRHRHVGEEFVLVLQGGIEEGGRILLPGDLVHMPADTEHEFRALEGDDLLYVAVVFEGVDFGPGGGPLILPRDWDSLA